jgi:hypothetical protein
MHRRAPRRQSPAVSDPPRFSCWRSVPATGRSAISAIWHGRTASARQPGRCAPGGSIGVDRVLVPGPEAAGISPKTLFAGNQHPADRPSDFGLKYLGGKGYRVIPVNEGIARQVTRGSPADRPPRIRPAHGLSEKLTTAQDSLGKRGGFRTLGPGGRQRG